MWFINCILLVIGTVAAVMGVSFYWRNVEASGNLRLYIFLYGVTSALWCLSYGMIGITDNLALCEPIRKAGVFAINLFLLTEVFLVSEMSGAKQALVRTGKRIAALISVVDFFVFAQSGVDVFLRKGGYTTWVANEAFTFHRRLHGGYILLIYLILIYFGYTWTRTNKIKRLRHFLVLVYVSNYTMLFFTLPDTFLPALGFPAVSTSGIGAAACAIVMWYGATQLASFDIRMGSIKDTVFDFIEAGVIVFDVEKRAALFNHYVRERTDQKLEEEWSLGEFFSLEGLSEDEIFSCSENEIYAIKLWNNEKSNAYSVRINAVRDSFGETFCYMCVFVDVTEEISAVRKFEIASETKSRFLAQMSHEIRTPINAVLGMNEMILRKERDEEILDYAKNIDSAGNTLLTLINSILDFSKIEDGKMEIIPVRYDTASLVNEVVNSVIQRADAKGLAFETDIDEALPTAMIGDDVRFSQVIMNLLSNAVKYTKKGSVTLAIREQERHPGGDTVRLYVEVRDTGIGIREEDRVRLFESFERLDEVRNHDIEGTGLGISIVTSLLAMMGSRLEVESTYGEGSCFSFFIEQRIADGEPLGDYRKRIRESYRDRREEETIAAPNARVLVVDDNDMNRKVASNLLKLCQIRADLVPSGASALVCMRKWKYDIVFLDHMMPEMDGVETLRKVHEENLVPESTAVIALTANAVVGARESYLEEGFTDYLSKPIGMNELIEKLKKYLPKEAYEVGPEEEMNGMEFDSNGVMEFDSNGVMEFDSDGSMEFEPQEAADSPGASDGSDPDREAGILYELAACGVNVDSGLSFAADDFDFYLELIQDYCRDHEEKSGVLQDDFERSDWKNYEITVHALKGTSRTLGMESMADHAAELEKESRNGGSEEFGRKHDALMAEYGEMVKKLSEIIGA